MLDRPVSGARYQSTAKQLQWHEEVTSMSRQFDVVVEKDSEGFFVATVPALPGCHTQAKSLDQLMERIKEAIELCLEVEGTDPESLDFVGVQRITVEV
jgi:predicted RNase H-like HicB family nuclease